MPSAIIVLKRPGMAPLELDEEALLAIMRAYMGGSTPARIPAELVELWHADPIVVNEPVLNVPHEAGQPWLPVEQQMLRRTRKLLSDWQHTAAAGFLQKHLDRFVPLAQTIIHRGHALGSRVGRKPYRFYLDRQRMLVNPYAAASLICELATFGARWAEQTPEQRTPAVQRKLELEALRESLACLSNAWKYAEEWQDEIGEDFCRYLDVFFPARRDRIRQHIALLEERSAD